MAYFELSENSAMKTYRLLMDGATLYEGPDLLEAMRIFHRNNTTGERNDAPRAKKI